jgi:hypothetical protein
MFLGSKKLEEGIDIGLTFMNALGQCLQISIFSTNYGKLVLAFYSRELVCGAIQVCHIHSKIS